jgi:nucleobase:cation symporter-1, NCS1 family
VAGPGGPGAAAGGRLHHPARDGARPRGRANTRGRFAWRGLLAYAIGLAAEWPFVSQPDYTGPLVKTLGGADIS